MTKLVIIILIVLNCQILLGQTGFIDGEPKLAFWEFGYKENILVVLHGGPCVEHQYLRPEFDLLRKHCRVIYYDQRGCGLSSEADSYKWEDHVQDLKRIIDNLGPDRKVFLAGSSWGSSLALLYAYQHPTDIQGLLLSGLVNWRGKGLDKEQYNDINVKFGSNRKDTMYLRSVLESNENKRIAIWNVGRRSREPLHSLQTAPLFDSLKNIRTPILIFREDDYCHYSEVIEKYENILLNTTSFKISGSCHDTWLSNPKLFFKISNKFIKKTIRQK